MKEFSAQLRFILCGVWSKVCNNQDKDEDFHLSSFTMKQVLLPYKWCDCKLLVVIHVFFIIIASTINIVFTVRKLGKTKRKKGNQSNELGEESIENVSKIVKKVSFIKSFIHLFIAEKNTWYHPSLYLDLIDFLLNYHLIANYSTRIFYRTY